MIRPTFLPSILKSISIVSNFMTHSTAFLTNLAIKKCVKTRQILKCRQQKLAQLLSIFV